MVGQEQAIIAFIIGLVCCLGIGVLLLAVGGFLFWKRSKSEGADTATPVASMMAEDDGEDTLVAERPSSTTAETMDDGPSIVTQTQGANPEAPSATEPPRRAAQTIIAFDDDFDDDEEL